MTTGQVLLSLSVLGVLIASSMIVYKLFLSAVTKALNEGGPAAAAEIADAIRPRFRLRFGSWSMNVAAGRERADGTDDEP